MFVLFFLFIGHCTFLFCCGGDFSLLVNGDVYGARVVAGRADIPTIYVPPPHLLCGVYTAGALDSHGLPHEGSCNSRGYTSYECKSCCFCAEMVLVAMGFFLFPSKLTVYEVCRNVVKTLPITGMWLQYLSYRNHVLEV
jgi:hypothetical protein